MATVVYVPGLGYPDLSSEELGERLTKEGHKFVVVNTSKVVKHQDRVNATLIAYGRASANKDEPVFLIGQSAGGSAVRIAAEHLWLDQEVGLAGVILLSPAMPKGISALTWPSVKVMLAHAREILCGGIVRQTRKEFASRMMPLASDLKERILVSRGPVSGKEIRTLAFAPPALGVYCYPTLHIWGDRDACIAPRAQDKLSHKLLAMSYTSSHPIRGAGHMTLASEQREEVIGLIVRWVNVMASSHILINEKEKHGLTVEVS